MDNPYKAPKSELGLLSPASGSEDVEPLDKWIPASNGLRLGGYLIDSVLCFGMIVVFFVVLALGSELFGIESEWVFAVPDELVGIATMIPLAFISGLLEGSELQASLGKKVLGLRVVTLSGEDLDVATSMKRNFTKWLGLGVCGLLALSVYRNNGSSWWDSISGTLVVRRNPYA